VELIDPRSIVRHGDGINGDVDISAYKCSSELSAPVTCPCMYVIRAREGVLLVAESWLAVGAREFIIGAREINTTSQYHSSPLYPFQFESD
jgi:hypothetical protein